MSPISATLTPTPRPSTRRPDLRLYERRESQVRSYCRAFPRTFVRGSGSYLFDDEGGAYLDFLSGCSTLNYGHNDPALKQALLEYIEKDGVAHGLDMHTEAKAEFLQAFETLILKPRDLDYRVMFTGPTGTNAVEAAMKLARKVTGRTNIIAFTNGFHGMTLGALAATGNGGKRGGAGLPLAGVTRMPYDGYFGDGIDTADHLAAMLADPSSGIDAPAAILLEVVQGEGGLNVASDAWLRRIAMIARNAGALLIVDDIQAGVGRTGGFFSFERAGITPDIVTLAKSLSGLGLPFALTLFRPGLDDWTPGEHNGTFRGNNHAFVTAAAALKHYWSDDAFEREVARKSDALKGRLETIARRFAARGLRVKGRGMMMGLDVTSGEIAEKITTACFARGLIIETSGGHDEVVKVLCPLTITDGELTTGLDILEKAVTEALGTELPAAAE
ncbi:MAG: diaminobutyrate--2-oxoglutarate transaminase [Alphaproteobacteria bacterium]|nr:diaminobutyrate--2-oxoglutarate transaminase [Alphaproteobacteria bacterium]